MQKLNQLGFPVPLLGMAPLRLPILYDDGEILALAKPVNVLVQADSWYPRLPVLIEAIRHQALAGKPEFLKLSIGPSGLWAVTDLDPECYGPVVFARDRQVAEELRNSVGAGDFTFKYKFLTRSSRKDGELHCDLPLARHRQQNKMLVSHTTGKKAVTHLRRVEQSGPVEIWEGTTDYPRRHQLLLHPLEAGLPVLGDACYAREKSLLLSRLKRNYQPKRDVDERPLYEGAAYFLEQILLANGETITAPEPHRWRGLTGQLSRCSRV